MGCSLSSRERSNDAVSLCRERKRLMKMTIEHRQAFSHSHWNYTRSLSSLSSALRLLIARFEDGKPVFEESETADHDDEEERSGTEEEEEEDQGVVCEYFYEDKKQPPPPPPMPEPERGLMGWDFFGLFDHNSIETMCLIDQGRDVDEEDRSGDENHGRDHHHHLEKKEVVVTEKVNVKEESGKGLMEALREVQELFARACEGGFGVSRMLEVNEGHHLVHSSYLGEIKELSSNFMNSISWYQPVSNQSSPRKSLLSNSSATSSTWTECRSDVFDGCGGMRSGSHSFTLGRLYAWETKLFEEVKAGQKCSKSYQKKWAQLNRQAGDGEDLEARDKDEVTELYTKVLVSRRSAECIYKQIEKLRDEELLPQILELLDGLMRTWKMMLESHEIQARAMRLVKSSSRHDYSKFCCESNGILELEDTLQTWHACFSAYRTSQKAYIKTLHEWLSMFVGIESDMYSNGKDLIPKGVQPLLATFHKWLDSLDTLPEKAVKNAIRDLTKDVRSLWVRQGEEQRQLRRVDGLAKEIDIRSVGYLNEAKDYRDQLIKKLEMEKLKHQDYKIETQRATFNTLVKGFSSVFEAMVKFSMVSVELHADLLAYYETAKDRSHETDDRVVERQEPSVSPP